MEFKSLTAAAVPPFSFNQITPGLGPTPTGIYELRNGGAFAVAASLANTQGYTIAISGTYYSVFGAQVSPTAFFVGNSVGPLATRGTYFSLVSTPLRDAILDFETNVTVAAAGKLRRNNTGTCYQGSLADNGNTQRFKSFCQLWETGSISADGVTQFFAVSFANAQKDANYFVVLEKVGATDNLVGAVDSKTNTGFSIDFTAVPTFDAWNWFAVRYGI